MRQDDLIVGRCSESVAVKPVNLRGEILNWGPLLVASVITLRFSACWTR